MNELYKFHSDNLRGKKKHKPLVEVSSWIGLELSDEEIKRTILELGNELLEANPGFDCFKVTTSVTGVLKKNTFNFRVFIRSLDFGGSRTAQTPN